MRTQKKTERARVTKEGKETDKVIKQEKEPFVYGYKALDENLCASMGDGMQFEEGKTYDVKGELKFCENGFHFCENLEDTLDYYGISKGLRFIKIKAYGEVLSDNRGSKLLCRKIKVVKELSGEDILRALGLDKDTSTEVEILEKTPEIRELLSLKGFFLNTLVNDEDWYVRRAVAEQGHGLDVLINDKDWAVRRVVAEQGYELNILVNDESYYVRRAVAEQGHGLNILINDENYYVRAAVAEQGFGLDVLVNDESWYVRCKVVRQGHGLDILVNDEDWRVRAAVAEQKYGLDVLINDENWNVRRAARQRQANANERK